MGLVAESLRAAISSRRLGLAADLEFRSTMKYPIYIHSEA